MQINHGPPSYSLAPPTLEGRGLHRVDTFGTLIIVPNHRTQDEGAG